VRTKRDKNEGNEKDKIEERKNGRKSITHAAKILTFYSQSIQPPKHPSNSNIVAETGTKQKEEVRAQRNICLNNLACTAVTTQRPKDKQLYQRRF
jgi:hypothetical protein